MNDAPLKEAERSPSPAPPPPVATAPGPRATALQKLYADAIAHVLKTCSYSNFASCFPTPAKEVPDSMRHLHEQFTTRLGDVMKMNFEQILTERNVVPSLNELDALIEDAKKRKAKAEEEAYGKSVQAPIPYVAVVSMTRSRNADWLTSQTTCATCATAVPFTPGSLPLSTITGSTVATGSIASRERRYLAKSVTAKEGDRGHNEGSRECGHRS